MNQIRQTIETSLCGEVHDESRISKDIGEEFDVHSYDFVVVAFSGGKDSVATLLHMLDLGVDKSRIILCHHLVDGREGSTLMDWKNSESYCRAFADAFDLPIRFSWREGGFEQEMNRKDQLTGNVLFEDWDDPTKIIRLKSAGKPNTRRKFPQVSADLSVRYCSSYLKIDVFSRVINNSPMFLGKRTLVITGERAQESSARARYSELEKHRCDGKKRTVHQWRPIHKWPVEDVWDIMKRYKVNPHPAYKMGWNRLSCRNCIFISANAWATNRKIDPDGFNKIAAYEKEFDTTIHRKQNVNERADKGTAYAYDSTYVDSALSTEYNEPIIVENWELPLGASSCEVTGPS